MCVLHSQKKINKMCLHLTSGASEFRSYLPQTGFKQNISNLNVSISVLMQNHSAIQKDYKHGNCAFMSKSPNVLSTANTHHPHRKALYWRNWGFGEAEDFKHVKIVSSRPAQARPASAVKEDPIPENWNWQKRWCESLIPIRARRRL